MLAGGDNVCDELLAVHAHLHGGPVLGQLRRKLQLLMGLQGAVFGQPWTKSREAALVSAVSASTAVFLLLEGGARKIHIL